MLQLLGDSVPTPPAGASPLGTSVRQTPWFAPQLHLQLHPGPSAPNFGGSLLFMHTPLKQNYNIWRGNTYWAGLVFRESGTPHPMGRGRDGTGSEPLTRWPDLVTECLTVYALKWDYFDDRVLLLNAFCQKQGLNSARSQIQHLCLGIRGLGDPLP